MSYFRVCANHSGRVFKETVTLVRYSLVLFAGLVAISGCAPNHSSNSVPSSKPSHPRLPAVAGKDLTNTFLHEASGLSIKAPAGWGFVPDSKVEYVTAECRPRASQGDLPVILVQTAALKTYLTLESFVSSYAQKIGKGVDNPKIEKDEAIKGGVQGAEGYEIRYTGKLKGQPITGSLVILRKDKWFTVLTRICRQLDSEKLQPTFDEFMRGLKLEKR